MFDLVTKFMVFLTLFAQSCQILTLFASYSPNQTNHAFYSIQATPSHVISIIGSPNNDVVLAYYHPVLGSLEVINITVTGLAFDSTARIRTAQFNNYANITGFGLLYFNSSCVRYFTHFSNMNIQIYTTPSPTILIREVCLGVFKSIIYVLVEDIVGNSYSIYFYDTTIKISEALLTVTSSGNAVHSLKFNNNILMLTLSSRLVLYSCVGFVFGPILLDIQYPNTSLSYIDAKIYNQFLIYSTGYSLYIYNLTSSTYIRNYTCPHQIESIAKVSSCIIITCAIGIYQYDYEIDQVISTFPITVNYSALLKGEIMGIDQLVLYEQQGNMARKFQLFNLSFQYQPPSASTNGTADSPLPQQPARVQPSYNQFVNKSLSFLTTETASLIFSLSAIKTMPKFLLVLSLLANDLVYYRFHRKFQPEYPNSTMIFMEKFGMMKEVGSSSIQKYTAFLDNSHNTFSASNERALKSLQFTKHDPPEVYFLYSASDLQCSILMCVVSYSVIKLVHFLLYMVRDKHQMFRKCSKYLGEGSQWWVLIVSIVESNINELVFRSSLQHLVIGSNSLVDKANILAMHLIFFVLFVYCLSFYGLIYATQRKNCSQILIVYLKSNNKKSYFCEPNLVLFRSLMKSFAHGYLIHSYPTQIICLFIIDVIFLLLCLSLCRKFNNKFAAFCVVSYFLGFTLFDLLFILELHAKIIISWDRQLVGLIFCYSLAGLSLLLSFVLMISSFQEIFSLIKNMFIKNKTDSSNKQNQIEKVSFGNQQTFNLKNKVLNISCPSNNNFAQSNERIRRLLKTRKISKSKKQTDQKQSSNANINKLLNLNVLLTKNQGEISQTAHEIDEIQLEKNQDSRKN